MTLLRRLAADADVRVAARKSQGQNELKAAQAGKRWSFLQNDFEQPSCDLSGLTKRIPLEILLVFPQEELQAFKRRLSQTAELQDKVKAEAFI